MLFYGYYLDPLYIMVAVITLSIMLVAQILVKSRYSKYSRIRNTHNITGAQAAERILKANGIFDVRVEKVSGKLTDHFDPKAKVIRLSEGVYDSPSISAVGIAAHEAGHAVQHAEGYIPIKIRTAIVPFAQYGPSIGIILMLIGVLLNFYNLTLLGVVLFGATFIFQFVTLPVEFNASSRALRTIRDNNLLLGDEIRGARKVLTAAALTYVAAMISSLLTLLYYATRFLGRSRRQ